ARRPALLAKNQDIQAHLSQGNGVKPLEALPAAPAFKADHSQPAPIPPDLKLHLLSDFAPEEIFSYINPIMLYGKHLGLKSPEQSYKDGKPKAVELYRSVRDL